MTFTLSVNHGVRKVLQGMDSAKIVCWSSDAGELNQQLRDAFELVEETVRKPRSALLTIKAGSFKEIKLSSSVKGYVTRCWP